MPYEGYRSLSLFCSEETVAQTGQLSYPRSHSKSELRFLISVPKLLLFESTFHNFLPICLRRKGILQGLADIPTRTRKE